MNWTAVHQASSALIHDHELVAPRGSLIGLRGESGDAAVMYAKERRSRLSRKMGAYSML